MKAAPDDKGVGVLARLRVEVVVRLKLDAGVAGGFGRREVRDAGGDVGDDFGEVLVDCLQVGVLLIFSP